MNKLMIAAAAAAMIGGAYASDECVACGYTEPVTGVNPAFYDLSFKLKTLAPKAVKCGGCEGIDMEQTTRTINGLLWTCDNCVIPYQYALWEKASQTLFTDPIEYRHSSDQVETWAVTGVYEVMGDYTDSQLFIGSTKPSDQAKLAFVGEVNKFCSQARYSYGAYTITDVQLKNIGQVGAVTNVMYIELGEATYTISVPGTFSSEAAAIKAAKEYKLHDDLVYGFVSATAEKTGVKAAGTCYWYATAWDDTQWYRYGKKADKVEMSIFDDFDGLYLNAVAFGTFDTKNLRVKSASGYAVGTIDPDLIACTDEPGNYAEICADFDCSVECWDIYGGNAEQDNTFFSGTWTVKLNNGYPKKAMTSIVPNWVIGTIDSTCAE